MEIKFHGHSCFELSEGETTVLVDPFLKPNNPVRWPPPRRSSRPISRSATATPITSPTRSPSRSGPARTASRSSSSPTGSKAQGVAGLSDPNLGGTIEFDWGWIKLVPAWHTSTAPGSEEAPYSAEHGVSLGTATGLIIRIGDDDRLPHGRHLPFR